MLATALVGPQRLELRDDALAELVRAGMREREAGVRVQALQRARAGRGAADAELEARAAVLAGLAGGECLADAALLVVRADEAVPQLLLLPRCGRPALDAARRL